MVRTPRQRTRSPGRQRQSSSDAVKIPRMLRERAVLYHALFENANDAIAVLSLEGIIVNVNRGAERLLGWSKAELQGQHVQKVATAASVLIAEERTRRFLVGEKLPSSLFEAELMRKDGTIVPVEARTRVIRDRARRPIGFQGVFRDISERKEKDAQLRASEARYRTLVEQLPVVLYIVDANGRGRTRYVNPAIEPLLGFTPADWTADPDPWRAHLHPEDQERIVRALQESQRTGRRFRADYRLFARDGRVVWVHDEIVTATETDAEGRPLALLGMMTDISERKHLETLVQQDELRRPAFGARLRAFRESLGMTQPVFGQTFGGYNQRQMSSYETGDVDIPLAMLLTIRAHGYPLELVLAANSPPAQDAIVSSLTARHPERVLTARLLEAALQLLHREQTVTERVMAELQHPSPPLSAEQQKLLDQLAVVLKA